VTYCSCRYTHYVPEAAPSGQPVTALCGKVWVPGMHADCHKRCPECAELLASIPAGWVA
jgi:hypothetical protein